MEKKKKIAPNNPQYTSIHRLIYASRVSVVLVQWMGIIAMLRFHVMIVVAEHCWVHYALFLLSLNSPPEKNKDNPVKCLTDGDTDAKPSHQGVKTLVEMNLVVLLG